MFYAPTSWKPQQVDTLISLQFEANKKFSEDTLFEVRPVYMARRQHLNQTFMTQETGGSTEKLHINNCCFTGG